MFQLGRILATPGALAALEEAHQAPVTFLQRHATGDWGDLADDDKLLNAEALVDGSRIPSAYRTSLGARLWVITEAVGDGGQRCATTLLLPEEY